MAVKVADRRSREITLSIDFSLDGGTSWRAATGLFGKSAGQTVSSSPEGTEHAFTWSAHRDLGTGLHEGVLVRVTPSQPRGKPAVGEPIEELITYDVPSTGDLHADLLADLSPDGTLDGFVLADVRGEDDHAAGHLPGAVFVSFADIQERGREALPWPLDTRIVFYCYGGG